jgi:FKBP-type peptidyl-prolyl cis-trans isomerase
MRRNKGFAPALALFSLIGLAALSACQSQTGSASFDTDDQKASYGIGIQMGSQLVPAGSHLDMDAFVAGIRDGKDGKEPAVAEEEIQAALQALNEAIRSEEAERIAVEGEANAAAGEAFLAENAFKDGVTVTESGLQYEVLREGDGPSPGPEDQVSINYKGTLIDGTQFDSSYDRGQPAVFGVGGVIPGFSEGLQLMTVGSQYRFFIPSDIGYGPSGTGGAIGPNATLIFEVELLEIVQ